MGTLKCLDTYALIEIVKGNPHYMNYLTGEFVIPDPTLAEFSWVLHRDYSEADAEHWTEKLKNYCSAVNKTTLLNAVKFRYKHRKNNISFFDAIGYTYAQEHHLPFVTGDKEFKHFPDVEFLK